MGHDQRAAQRRARWLLAGELPPGVVLGIDRGLSVYRAFVYAHAACYDAIKAADTIDADGDGQASRISVAAALRTFHPYDPTDSSDVAATAHVKYIANDWFLNAVTRGDLDYDFDGTLTGPNDLTGDPSLKGRLDYVGVNYYTDTQVSGDHGLVLPAPISASLFLPTYPRCGRRATSTGTSIRRVSARCSTRRRATASPSWSPRMASRT